MQKELILPNDVLLVPSVNTNQNILPDSRLKNKAGSIIAEVDVFGKVWRFEMEPIYCIGCHKGPEGYIPMNVGIASISWACQRCSLERCGVEMSKGILQEQKFWAEVSYEMFRRFGYTLNQWELFYLGEQDRLGKELKLLERESPFRVK
jgi:hypothetical protein